MKKMTFLRYLLVSIAAIIIAPGCGDSSTGTRSKSNNLLKVINVLDDSMYNDAHITGSIHIDFGKVLDIAKRESWPLETKIVFYCSNYMCTASGQEAKSLKEAGYNNVAVYEGGMAEWYQLSKNDPAYKLEGPAVQEYLMLPNEKPSKDMTPEIPEITAQELKELLANS